MRRLWSALPILTVTLAMGVSTTSCGGGGDGSGTNPDLVLLGFNQPNVSGVALNQPLIFTFSADINDLSITPDTLRIVGAFGPFFELTHVDGPLVALLPRAPNFGDLSDVGMAPNTLYNVSLTTFPAVDTIESVGGKPLLEAATFTFRTVPSAPYFIESRRPLEHGTPPSQDGRSDDEGCIQNPTNSLYIDPFPATTSLDPLPQQSNSGPGGRLLCLQNEGRPHVVPELCLPLHDQRAVGTPAGGSQNVGKVFLPALTLAFNEQLDPSTAVPYNTATKLGANVQLWRVALLDGTALTPPEPVQTNTPLVVQNLASTQVLLVASSEVLQGIYLINLTGNIKDLAGNALFTADKPNLAGQIYAGLDANLGAAVPQGWRLYFQTLQLAGTAAAINESFGSNLAESGDRDGTISPTTNEPGVFTQTSPNTNLIAPIAGMVPLPNGTPNFTLLYGPYPGTASQCGQSTTANWNGGFRFLNLASLESNTAADPGLGRLKAVWRPYLGNGGDGAFDSNAGAFGSGPGDNVTLSTTPGSGASANGDGIYEYESFFLRAGDTITVAGTRPLLILCRGAFEVEGTIELSGANGGFGLDTDGSTDYTNSGAITPWGVGGQGGPGGGNGGRGAGPIISPSAGASLGTVPATLFGPTLNPVGGPGPGGSGNAVGGGGGGGFAAAGLAGTKLDTTTASNGGGSYGTPLFERALSNFVPDRGYFPCADVSGGAGAGGGGARDNNTNGTVDNGDAAGGGGGGAGGGIWVIAGGQLRVGPTGVIRANGGNGGSTYNKANQRVNPGNDGNVGGGDDFVDGLKSAAVPSGLGGPGGGGAGGGIVLMAQGGVNIQAASNPAVHGLRAQGGAGGSSGTAGYVGGNGSDGRIALLGLAGGAVSNLGTVLPAPSTAAINPTVRNASVGQSQWIDLFTSTVDFAPLIATIAQVPFATTNFQALIDAGLVQGPASDFDAKWEFQAADTLSPLPSVGPPTVAGGVGLGAPTQWNTDINLCDSHRYFRYRWAFYVREGYPGTGLTALPMPAVLDCTIPFKK